MKKQILYGLMITTMVLSSCANSGNNAGSSEQPVAENTTTADDEEQSAEETASLDSQTEEGQRDLSDGSPWIDSDLSENLSKDMQTDPKDDFHLYSSLGAFWIGHETSSTKHTM